MLLRRACLSTLLASLLACGGRVESTGQMPQPVTTDVDGGDGASNACPLPTAAAVDPLENCTRYCAGYGCAACPSSIAQCELLCGDLYEKGTLDAPCLACAVANDRAILSKLSCDDFVSQGPRGPVFTMLFPERECGNVCTLPR